MAEKKTEKDNLNPYKVDRLARIPSWIKILLLKYWAAGAAFFFFGIGGSFVWYRGHDVEDTVRLAALLTLGMALFQEYIIKQFVRLMRNSRDNTFYYNMINVKGTKSFFLNLLYSFIVIIPTIVIMGGLESVGLSLNLFGLEGIDPFSMGLVYVVIDFIYLFIKNSCIALYKRYKYTKLQKELDKEN